MDARSLVRVRRLAAVLAVVLVLPAAGCVGLLAQMAYWAGAAQKPAEYKGLAGKRVAVICVSEASSFGLGTDSLYMARAVGQLLKQNVKDITVVRPDEIADWIDRHDWNEIDFAEVGRGVNAEMVVAIELSAFSLFDGPTLYRGRADMRIRVLDMKAGGGEVYSRRMAEITFPTNAAYPATDASETKFRLVFLQSLAERVARLFYAHEVWDSYGSDAPSII